MVSNCQSQVFYQNLFTILIALPQIQEDSGETGKKGYVNFKRVVWHKAFYEVLKSVEQYAETGYTMTISEFERWMFPIVLIASADYEEQSVFYYALLKILDSHSICLPRCMISLIRGLNSKFPCPVCLVPGDKLTDLSTDYPLRTTLDMEDIYKSAVAMNAADSEELLKNYGLRAVSVT